MIAKPPTILLFIFIAQLFFQTSSAAIGRCRSSLLERQNSEFRSTQSFDPGLPYPGYFKEIRMAIKDKRVEIEGILSKFNNDRGNKIELTQVLSFLDKVGSLELGNLRKIETLDNIVIYGSSNVPLYSLVTQGMLAASFGRNVWFRTPEISREVYAELFNIIRSQLAPPALKNLHLVTDPSDLSYDMFNRLYVMGMNRQGTRNIRKPSDLVILTGSPETARKMIERNQKKLEELAPTLPGFKQMFIGFLAGINPAIVTASSKKEIERVVQQVMEPALVNSGQDCMNSDVIFVHKSVYKKFYDTLVSKLQQIPLLKQGEHGVGLVPLSFSKNLDRLIAYKQNYLDHLQNAEEATIDPIEKMVSPHIFKFDFSELENLEIQEHFAPFFTIVTYDSTEQIELAIKSPRFQAKAMYGLLYGSTQLDLEQEQLRDLLRQYGHGVVHNSTLFDEFEMNFPFGGTGTDTSLVVKNEISKDGTLTSQWAHYPTLISKESRSFFPRQLSQIQVASPKKIEMDQSLEFVTVTLSQAALKPQKPSEWKIQDPNLSEQVLSLKQIQQTAKAQGLYLFSNYSLKQRSNHLIETEKLYGAPFLTSKYRSKKIPGVLIHYRSLNESYAPFNFARGDLNPTLGYGQLAPIISGNKLFDFHLIRAFDPQLMPPTQLLDEMQSFEGFGDGLNENKETVLASLKKVNSKPASSSRVVDDLMRMLSFIFSKVQKYFPEGAYFKNYGEFATGDMGTAITSYSTSPLAMAKEFISVYLQISNSGKYSIDSTLKTISESQGYDNYSRFIARLLIDHSQMLVQKNEPIKKTDLGQNMEVRVDFISGQTVGSRMRYGFEFYPDELMQAQNSLQEFLDKLPFQLRNMSGGADLAQLTDGRWIVLEFNFGAESGTRIANYYPFESNRIISKLIGKKTYFLKELDRISNTSIAHQRDYILSYRNEKPLWWRESISDISQIEIARFLRDLMLEKWLRSDAKERLASGVINQLTELLENIGSPENQDFKKLLHSSKQFIYRQLIDQKSGSS